LSRALLLCALALPVIIAAGRDASRVIPVPAGGDLQAAIEAARPGDTLALEPGAVYVGNFTLPRTGGHEFMTIRTAEVAGLPSAGERVQPAHATRLAKLQSPNSQPVLSTQPGAHHWRLQLLEFLPTRGGSAIIALGDGGGAQRDREAVPHTLEVDRCYIHGDPRSGQKRGIALNSGATAITGSYIADIKTVGEDSQAIAGWNGPGPYRIENNYLEAAGENFLLGGADPAIDGLVPAGLVFRHNHLSKPTAWRSERWQVKNLFQLKNARDALVEHNLMEHTWAQAQSGYAVLLTPRNQDGRAPWSTVEDVVFRHNVVRRAGAGLQITGEEDDRRNASARRITIADNLFLEIDRRVWGGAGLFLLIGNGPAEVVVERNAIDQSGNILSAFGGTRGAPAPIRGFVFRDNIVRHNAYGVHGADRGVGRDSLEAFFPGAVFAGNVIAGGNPKRYPDGNRFVGDDEYSALLQQAIRKAESRGSVRSRER
jgi:hypothetical protein